MNSSDVLRLVDQMHRDKNVDRDVIFDGIEAALELAAQKYFGEEEIVKVNIDRDSGEISVYRGEEEIDPTELGRIPAQSAKNVMIQKIREAESNAVFDEYTAMKGDLVYGTVQRAEPNAAIVSLGKNETILPRSEQIPGEMHHVNDRIKSVILEVKRAGQRVKIILSRCHPDFVRRLFENEIPEIQDRIIEIKAVAREAGYRTKIAVSSIDLKVDCVGACVGVRGSRIKNIVDELGGERIDIVRWNDSLQVMIPNALQPAEIEEVFIYSRPGRAIVLVKEDQLSLAIGRRGQNVRLASKLVGWDIEIMTHEELSDSIERAEELFLTIPGVTDEMAEVFIEEGFMSYVDLSFCDAAELIELVGIPEDLAESIVEFAEDQVEMEEEENTRPTRGPAPAPAAVGAGANGDTTTVAAEATTEETAEETGDAVESADAESDATEATEESKAAAEEEEVESSGESEIAVESSETDESEPEPEPAEASADDDEAADSEPDDVTDADAESVADANDSTEENSEELVEVAESNTEEKAVAEEQPSAT